jgi:hypothetical protein
MQITGMLYGSKLLHHVDLNEHPACQVPRAASELFENRQLVSLIHSLRHQWWGATLICGDCEVLMIEALLDDLYPSLGSSWAHAP